MNLFSSVALLAHFSKKDKISCWEKMVNKKNEIVKLESEPEKLRIVKDSKERINKENLLNYWLGTFFDIKEENNHYFQYKKCWRFINSSKLWFKFF